MIRCCGTFEPASRARKPRVSSNGSPGPSGTGTSTAAVDYGDARAVEINLFRQLYSTMPHQALGDRIPRAAPVDDAGPDAGKGRPRVPARRK